MYRSRRGSHFETESWRIFRKVVRRSEGYMFVLIVNAKEYPVSYVAMYASPFCQNHILRVLELHVSFHWSGFSCKSINSVTRVPVSPSFFIEIPSYVSWTFEESYRSRSTSALRRWWIPSSFLAMHASPFWQNDILWVLESHFDFHWWTKFKMSTLQENKKGLHLRVGTTSSTLVSGSLGLILDLSFDSREHSLCCSAVLDFLPAV